MREKSVLDVHRKLGEVAMHQEIEINAVRAVIVSHDLSIGELPRPFHIIKGVICYPSPLRYFKLRQAGHISGGQDTHSACDLTHIAQSRETFFFFDLHEAHHRPIRERCIADLERLAALRAPCRTLPQKIAPGALESALHEA